MPAIRVLDMAIRAQTQAVLVMPCHHSGKVGFKLEVNISAVECHQCPDSGGMIPLRICTAAE